MKKLFLALTVVTLVFSLSACGFLRDLFEDVPIDIIDDNDNDNGNGDPNDNGNGNGDITQYSLTISSNRGSDYVNASPEGPYDVGDTVTLTAEIIEDYVFLHWYDMKNGGIYSTERVIEITMTQDYHLNAIYISDSADLDVSSNIDSSLVSYTDGPYALGDTIEISTPEFYEDYTFLYWHDTITNHVFSYDTDVTFELNRYMNLVAIYQSNPTIAYETGFENDERTSYGLSWVEVEGEPWIFDTALIGRLANDKRSGSQSVRMDTGGSIRTDFGIMHPTSISFKHATYGSDDLVALRLSISPDGLTWHHLDEINTSLTLSSYSYSIDLFELWEEGIIGPNDEVYFRIQNMAGGRANIDDVQIEHFEDFVGFPNPEHISQFIDFTFDRDFTEVYSLGDTWEANTCIAVDAHMVQVDCWLSGEVDTSTRGSYTLTYAALDQLGNITTYTVTKAVMRDATLLDMELDGFSGYYEGLEGLYGDDLFYALRELLWDGVTLQNYGDARYILQESDVDPNDPDRVIHIYTGESVMADWDAYRQWDREHIWPNSRLGLNRAGNTSVNAATDLHNLRPINAGINSSRSNKYFDYETTTNTWDPDVDRGNVARVYFYMVVMWDHLQLLDELATHPTYTVYGAQQGFFSVLIDFHFSDPVRDFERTRNEVIYTYQNNRNPFIDYPHFVELIYFDHPMIPEVIE